MYKPNANRKEWPLTEVKTKIEVERDEVENTTIITRKIAFIGDLTNEQRTRLMTSKLLF